MARTYLVIGVLILGLFNYAQYQGWSLFADDANPTPARSAHAARIFHK